MDRFELLREMWRCGSSRQTTFGFHAVRASSLEPQSPRRIGSKEDATLGGDGESG